MVKVSRVVTLAAASILAMVGSQAWAAPLQFAIGGTVQNTYYNQQGSGVYSDEQNAFVAAMSGTPFSFNAVVEFEPGTAPNVWTPATFVSANVGGYTNFTSHANWNTLDLSARVREYQNDASGYKFKIEIYAKEVQVVASYLTRYFNREIYLDVMADPFDGTISNASLVSASLRAYNNGNGGPNIKERGFGPTDVTGFSVTVAPEPGSLALLAAALPAVLRRRRA